MSQVKSPYNFVSAPIEDQVFKPKWASYVSHDIPFEDGESGEIILEINAETPIFIRDGQKKLSEEDRKKPAEFSHYLLNGKKQYFIPATSLKGMVRNVLEIMSFSRLAPIAMGNTIFGLREDFRFDYTEYKNQIKNVKAGWMIYEEGKWKIYPTSFDRITPESICNYFRLLNSNDFKNKSAKEKYEDINFKSFEEPLPISKGEFIPKTGQLYNLNKNGNFKRYLVVFGSFSTKKYEYLFHDFDDEEDHIELADQNLVRKIIDIESGSSDSLWQYFLITKRLKKIPVFYKEKNRKVIHFGFSKLYRLNNAHYLKELSPVSTYSAKDYEPDLAETIFGDISSKTGALKGRVFFSHALARGNPKELDKVSYEILGSPKPSYYPFYLKQKNPRRNGYSTYQNKSSELRGFKKYHIQGRATQSDYTQDQKDSESMVYFRPLEANTKFICKLRYHNLKPFELGALLSALTYHNNHDQLRHNLGMAKSMGYGKIKMDLKIDSEKLKKYLSAFELEINKHSLQKFNKKWVDTDQIKDLGSLAKVGTDHVRLNFPKLEVEQYNPKKRKMDKMNEFNEIKKIFEFLKAPSEYTGSYFQIKSLL